MMDFVSHDVLQFGALKGLDASDILRFAVPLIVLSTVSVALRVYVRGFMTKTFGLSDWLILPAYIMFMAMSIISLLVGIWSLGDDALMRYKRIIEFSIAGSVLFVFGQIFIKLSVAAYFHRIVHERWQRHVIVFSVAIFVVFELVYVFITIFQCGVPTVSNLVVGFASGACISWDRVVGPINYVAVCLNATLDWIFVLASFPVVTKLRRMPFGEVLCICFLIFLATGASVLSLVRIKFIGNGQQPAILQHNITFAVLSHAEAGVAIVTVCMATLHPLFQPCFRRKTKSRLPATREPQDLAPTMKQDTVLSSQQFSTEYSSVGRIGILPTMLETNFGTTIEHRLNRPGNGTNTITKNVFGDDTANAPRNIQCSEIILSLSVSESESSRHERHDKQERNRRSPLQEVTGPGRSDSTAENHSLVQMRKPSSAEEKVICVNDSIA